MVISIHKLIMVANKFKQYHQSMFNFIIFFDFPTDFLINCYFISFINSCLLSQELNTNTKYYIYASSILKNFHHLILLIFIHFKYHEPFFINDINYDLSVLLKIVFKKDSYITIIKPKQVYYQLIIFSYYQKAVQQVKRLM